MKYLIVAFLQVILLFTLKAQQSKQIEVLNANTIEYDKNSGIDARRLIGDVQFKHESTIMYCDSAYFYTDRNFVDAFGHIAIHQGDTLHLYGDLLKYDGQTRVAQMRKRVKLLDNETTLTTDYLDFKINEDVGFYSNGGKIINGDNKLSSNLGYYYAKEKLFFYRGNVVVENPKYTIKSDTLKYHTVKRVAYFFGPTNITSEQNHIYCENGWYNTKTNICQFNKNAYLKSQKQLLKGDSLYYERNTGYGKAFKHIYLIDSTQSIILTGNAAWYRERPQFAMITDSAVFMQYSNGDTMFMHADTLKSEMVDTVLQHRIIRAFRHVKIFKSDLQGKCDSLRYTSSDSMMRLFNAPVLWSGENQFSADYIELQMANQQLKEARMFANSFVISKEDSLKFNQIKGKKMIGYFKNNQLYRVNVSGNGQTVYYAKDKEQIVGVNKAVCSDLIILIENKKIKKISFVTKPDATLFPLDKAPTEEIKLKGFKWVTSRPLKRDDIFIHSED